MFKEKLQTIHTIRILKYTSFEIINKTSDINTIDILEAL
jgi:hypothetical protein